MNFTRLRFLLVAALLTSGSAASAQSTTRIANDAPIVNFRLPTFTPEGFRQWLVRGSEARLVSAKEIDIRELRHHRKHRRRCRLRRLPLTCPPPRWLHRRRLSPSSRRW